MAEKLCFQVTETEKRKRLDEFLFDKIGEVSKMHLRSLLANQACQVNDKNGAAGDRLKVGDKVEIEVDLEAITSQKPENISLEIIFEDEEVVVVNKAAGMLVHPTKGVKSGTLLNALSYHLNGENTANFYGEDPQQKSESENRETDFIRPGLIHRLDKQTSGLMVISKNSRAHKILSGHFQRRLVEKRYFAVVDGIVTEDFGTINAPIGHNEEKRFWHISDDGKQAESRFRVLELRQDSTLLELEPVTGRTNQLRLHCAYIGHPILGDTIYGGREFSRLCLHAYRLCFWHPNGSRRLEFETKLPDGMN